MKNEPTFLLQVTPLFDVHGMLGGLAKWLRILGFDAAFPCVDPRHGRIFVTSSRAKRYPEAVYVSSGTALGQLKEVQERIGLPFDRELLLTRCLRCNEPVGYLPKELAAGRVPDRILAAFASFQHCTACNRVFWDGSHRKRIESRLAAAGIVFRQG